MENKSDTGLMRTLATLNQLDDAAMHALMLSLLHADRYAQIMESRRPFSSREELQAASEAASEMLTRDDWLQAFAAHPSLGEAPTCSSSNTGDNDMPRDRRWAAGEQAGIESDHKMQLKELNEEYRARHGFVFLLCATGRSGDEVVRALRERVNNDSDTEVGIAGAEQRKITKLRIDKMLRDGIWTS